MTDKTFEPHPIPKISDSKLQDLASRIRLVKMSNTQPIQEVLIVTSSEFQDRTTYDVEVGKGNYGELKEREYAIEHGTVKLFYQTEPSDLRNVSCIWDSKSTDEDTSDLEEFAMIYTYHTFGAPVLFKPSMAEVICQIPVAYIDDVIAVEICTHKGDYFATFNGETFHKARTFLYRKKI